MAVRDIAGQVIGATNRSIKRVCTPEDAPAHLDLDPGIGTDCFRFGPGHVELCHYTESHRPRGQGDDLLRRRHMKRIYS